MVSWTFVFDGFQQSLWQTDFLDTLIDSGQAMGLAPNIVSTAAESPCTEKNAKNQKIFLRESVVLQGRV